MEFLSEFNPLFQAFIAFGVFITIFTFAINLVVSPIKKDISRLEGGLSDTNKKIDTLNDKLDKVLLSLSRK